MTCCRSQAAVARLVHAFEPSVDLALGLVLGHAIALLESAAELPALAFDFQLPWTRSQFITCSCQCWRWRENPAREQKFRCASPRTSAETRLLRKDRTAPTTKTGRSR